MRSTGTVNTRATDMPVGDGRYRAEIALQVKLGDNDDACGATDVFADNDDVTLSRTGNTARAETYTFPGNGHISTICGNEFVGHN